MVVLGLCFTSFGVVVGLLAHRFVSLMTRKGSSDFAWALGFSIAVIVGLAAGMLESRFVLPMPPKMPPPSPLLRPFGDNKDWIVSEDIAYRIGDTADFIVVPRGFVTDFASIPQPLWSFGLSPHGQYSRAAVVHDFLYWTQGCLREQADRLLLIAMKESNVGWFDEAAIYAGVNIGGTSAWKSNAEERSVGLPKIVPSDYMRPEDPNVRWPDYRKLLADKGVRDPDFSGSRVYCKYGDTTSVPKVSTQSTTIKE